MNKLLILLSTALLSFIIFFSVMIYFYKNNNWSINILKNSKKQTYIKTVNYLDIPDITIAFPGKKDHYCKLSFTLAVDNKAQPIILDDKYKTVFRDSIIQIVTANSYENLSSYNGKVRLKQHIRTKLNKYLDAPSIRDVYYSELVLQ